MDEAVRRVVEAFDASDWSEIDVRFGDVRIQLSTTTAGAAPTAPTASSSPEPVAPSDPEAPSDNDAGPLPTETTAPGLDDIPPGAHLVVSPSPGIFWVAPEPGAPPFIEVGGRVDESSTIGIVEVMKLMNHVKAGVAGQIAAVLVGNGVGVALGIYRVQN